MVRIELNLNWSPRFDEEYIAGKAQRAEKAGIKRIWAGELDIFISPLEVARIVDEYTSIECGIITAPKPKREVARIAERYDVCIIPGGKGRDYVNSAVRCIEELGDCRNVYIGCSGRITARKAFNAFVRSGIEPRIMPNYVKREFVDWVCLNLEWVEILPIGPSLILPSRMEDELTIAAILVMTSNENFAREFGFFREFKELSALDVKRMIANSRLEKNETVERYRKFLMDNFTVSGSVEEVRKKVEALGSFVLGDPFFRDDNSMDMLEFLVN